MKASHTCAQVQGLVGTTGDPESYIHIVSRMCLSHPKSIYQYHSGGSLSCDPTKEIPHQSEGAIHLLGHFPGTRAGFRALRWPRRCKSQNSSRTAGWPYTRGRVTVPWRGVVRLRPTGPSSSSGYLIQMALLVPISPKNQRATSCVKGSSKYRDPEGIGSEQGPGLLRSKDCTGFKYINIVANQRMEFDQFYKTPHIHTLANVSKTETHVNAIALIS